MNGFCDMLNTTSSRFNQALSLIVYKSGHLPDLAFLGLTKH